MKKLNALLMASLMAGTMVGAAACGGGEETPSTVTADKYKIIIACQTEQGEEEVLKVLKESYEKKYTDREVEIKTFSGEGFEQYMLGISQNNSMSPNIIWTCDTLHSQWDEFFLDLRPYYESSTETDYSLFYESMLDTAATHGYFKPTKNYTNPLGAFNRELDAESDGKESYDKHSEYGLYYAPRDNNKPGILCNTYLFKELDTAYETVYTAVSGDMPEDYQSTYARLKSIHDGDDWDEMDDLYALARLIASRINYVCENTEDAREMRKWAGRRALNLFLDWEPTYTTVMNDLGLEVISDDGTLNLSAAATQLEELHGKLFPESAEADYMIELNTNSGFSKGNTFMTVCSRPAVLGYNKTLTGTYKEECLDTISFPVKAIAAGNSGYAISNLWDGSAATGLPASVTVNGVEKSYFDLSWDFIEYIITEEGQEAAGATGLNIPVLKKLYSAETNGGVVPAWRKVESLGSMNHDAWVAGDELSQDMFNIFKTEKRAAFRSVIKTFFTNMQRSNYNEGSLAALIAATEKNYSNQNPSQSLR